MIVPALRPYYVISPVYEEVVPILDDGSGPVEEGRDCELFWAPGRREAIILAVRKWRRRDDGWRDVGQYVRDRLSDGLNPFAGLKAIRAGCPECPPNDLCAACREELEAW